MENKGLLKLPETWHVVVRESNKTVLEKWFKKEYPQAELPIGFLIGKAKHKEGKIAILQDDVINSKWWSFGQEITFADFKRLVLLEKNHEDYGVLGCEELVVYFKNNNIEYLEGNNKQNIYYILSEWDYDYFENSKRQYLPLIEYLKLIDEKPESMEKKYEYRLRDEKYLEAILKLNPIADLYDGRNLGYMNSTFISILENLNVLDLFFEKIEVKELPIIGGSKPIISEDGDLIEIAGFQMDMYIIDHFKSFTLGNGIHVSESDVKQIREYLRK